MQINHVLIEYNLQILDLPSNTILAIDTYKNKPLHAYFQLFICNYLRNKDSHHLLPFPKLYKGMKVMLTTNIHQSLGLVNGAIGEIVDIYLNNKFPFFFHSNRSKFVLNI